MIKDWIRNHVVLLTVDLRNKRLEYFDPQGLTIGDRPGAIAMNGSKLTDIVNEAARDHFGTSITRGELRGKDVLVENIRRHQEDSYNCGIHVLDHATRRARNPQETFENLIKLENRVTIDDANGNKRREFINQLAAWHQDSPNETKPISNDSDELGGIPEEFGL